MGIDSDFNAIVSEKLKLEIENDALEKSVAILRAQLLAANGLAQNLLLMTNANGGWTTVASQSVGSAGDGGAHASTHHSGGADPLDGQYLRADGIGANQILMTHASGGFITISSASIASTNPLYIYFHADGGAAWALTNAALAVAFMGASNRHLKKVDLTDYNWVKLEMMKGATAGAAAHTGSLRFSKNYTNTIAQFTQSVADDGASGIRGAYVHFNFATNFTGTAWIALSSAVKQEGFIGVRTMGGDGVLDPQVDGMWAVFKK